MDRDFTIGFSTSKSFLSRCLRWIMRSKISHVYGSWKIHEDIRLVIGMESNGLDWRPLRKFNKKNELIYVFKPIGGELSDPVLLEKHLNNFGQEYANKTFAFSVMPLLFIYLLLGRLGTIGRWLQTKLHNSISNYSYRLFGLDKEVCCSAYMELLQNANYDFAKRLISHENNTQDLLSVMLNSDQWELIYKKDT